MLSQFPLTFLQTQNGTPVFNTELTTILMLIGMVFVIILRDVSREGVFKLGASTAGTKCCELVKVVIDIYDEKFILFMIRN